MKFIFGGLSRFWRLANTHGNIFYNYAKMKNFCYNRRKRCQPLTSILDREKTEIPLTTSFLIQATTSLANKQKKKKRRSNFSMNKNIWPIKIACITNKVSHPHLLLYHRWQVDYTRCCQLENCFQTRPQLWDPYRFTLSTFSLLHS